VIVSSHLLKDIELCCRDVLVLKQGRVVAAGNIEKMKKTSENIFELRVKGDLNRFMASLSELACDCRLGEREALQISTPVGFSSRTIFEVAQRHQVQIRHFYAKKDSLEDIFLKVLEDEIPEAENGRKKSKRSGEAADAGLRS
jgi:ABC-type multidrug transport system ATPase subunit